MKSKIYLLSILLSSISLQADPVPLKYEDLPTIVKERNQHVRASKILQEAAETETGHLTRSYLPTVSVTGGGETFSSGPNGVVSQPFGSLQGNINIFRGGRDLLVERQKQSNARKTSYEFEENYQEVLQEVRKLYWQIIYQSELILIFTEALEQNDRNAKGAARRIRAGLASETDRIEFELNALRMKQELERLKLNSFNAQKLLLAALGYSEENTLMVLDRLPHSHETVGVENDSKLLNHRSLKGVQAEKDEFSAQSSEAFRWWAPSVDIYGGYSLYTFRERDYNQQSDRLEPVLGVKLTVNVFDGFRSKNISTVTSLKAEAMQSRANQIERDLQAKLQTTKQELNVAHELIHMSESILEKAQRYLERTVTEYERGIKNSPDVLGATSRYYETKMRVIEMKRDYLIAKSRLANLLGQ